jgi:magnesium chelatase subunit I
MAALGLEPSVEVPGFAAAALEFALEGLWLTRRIGKDDIGGRVRYTAG